MGRKYFYSEMIMHTYKLSLTLNKSGSLFYYIDVSIAKYLYYKLFNLKKNYLPCKISKFKYFYIIIIMCMPMYSLTYVQKGLCGHQPCFHLELIS